MGRDKKGRHTIGERKNKKGEKKTGKQKKIRKILKGGLQKEEEMEGRERERKSSKGV